MAHLYAYVLYFMQLFDIFKKGDAILFCLLLRNSCIHTFTGVFEINIDLLATCLGLRFYRFQKALKAVEIVHIA
jgi:hypothetical protein